MTWRRLTATFLFAAALTAGEVHCPPFAAAQGGDTESVTVSAPGQLPKYSVRRTGAQELTVTFKTAPGEKAPPPPAVAGSKLVAGVRPAPGGFKVQLRTSAFGYVHGAQPEAGRLSVQVFADPIGARWAGDKSRPEAKPEAKPDAKAEPKPEQKPDAKAQAAAERKAAQEMALAEKKRLAEAKAEEAARKKAEADAAKRDKEEAARRAKEAAAQPKADAKPAALAPATQQPAPAPATPVPATPAPTAPAQAAPAAQTQSAPGQPGEGKAQPYFSVPYIYRAPVSKAVLGPQGGTATLPPVAGQAPQPATPETPAAKGQSPKAPDKPVGGKLPAGVVEKPILQDQHAAAPQAPPAAPPAPALPPPPDVQPQKGKAEVRFRADHRGSDDPRFAEVVSGVAAQAKAATTEPAKVAQAPGAGARPWEIRQPVQKGMVLAEANATQPPAPQPQDAAPHAPPPAAQPAAEHSGPKSTVYAAPNASGNASDGAPNKEHHGLPANYGTPKEKETPPADEQGLKDKLLNAQSNMMGGNWAGAVKLLEELLREPNLKGDMREEALYSLGDALMQQHKDALAANYDKIAGAQQAAMNANQKSRRVPRALLNLGLLNLRVNNLPEAKAYFSIIRKKFKNDQNASMVPFSLGEYYRAKGDLKQAAEQYQQLIQDYPDSRLLKDTAYILAQTLRRLGNFEKAYQITEYIDKRWDSFYMDAPDFLRLQAEVEEKVGKLAQAKDHYWTYFNLNPNSEYADVTLVRIGDIYLRQNKRQAAKEVYQKAVRDYPDREGAQVARMRIAEEGVFDDPTMSEMVSVFGRPDSLKPNETYELIMTKHAQSPLAPLAQLKLGMWQLYSKAYLDALSTATSFLEKHPKSPLVGKAKELGFQAFMLALPQLVAEGNYQRIMQLFDSASFVKENQDKISDEARLAIAVSAWKRGDPDRALKLAGKFLGREQVPRYSEMALDLAMNIFMERKQWSRISDLAARASAMWKLSPRQKAQFEHARAMALENAGEGEKSLPIWTRIASDPGTDLPTRAFATYTLAKDAARKQDMHRLFALSQDALNLLLQSGGDKDKIKDCLLMSITATERAGRFSETLKWAKEFDRIIPDTDPDWAPVRMRLADIYRQGGQVEEWRTLLTDIVKKKPGTVYARAASQALESSALDQRLQKYLQGSGS